MIRAGWIDSTMLEDFKAFQQRRDAVGKTDPRNDPHRQLLKNQSAVERQEPWSEYGKPAYSPEPQGFPPSIVDGVYRGQPVDYPAAAKSRPIPTTIDAIDANLVQLHQALANLTERLFPILGPVPPCDANPRPGGFSIGSPDRVIDRLSEFVWRTRAAIDQVAELANRIEV